MSDVLIGATATAYSSQSTAIGAPSDPANVNDGNDSTVSKHGSGVTPVNDGRVVYTGWVFTNLNGDGDTYAIDYLDVLPFGAVLDTVETSVDGGATWQTRAHTSSSPGGGFTRLTLTGGPYNANAIRAALGKQLSGGAGFNWSFYDKFGAYTVKADGAAPAPDAPVADFSASPNPADVGETVTFTDLSTNTPTSWSWDFGDSGTSTSQNPTHAYAAAGSYDVTLTATNAGGSDSITKTAFVVVNPAPSAGVYLDFDNDGFGSGDYDDVSADAISWTISRGSGAEITGQATPGSCVLTLKNSVAAGAAADNLYNPANASGPLYGKLRDGIPIWIGVNSDGVLSGSDPRGLFGGYVTDIAIVAAPGAAVAPTVQITCEDFLGRAARLAVRLDYAEGLSHAAFRENALVYVGESRYELDNEIQTMPLSHADTDLASLLASINAINGTRHYVRPADNFTDWYAYVTRNRFYRLDATTDGSVDAGSEHVTSTDGWRLSADTVTNQQRATVEPIDFTSGAFTVWQHDTLPFDVTADKPFTLWVDFDDVVRDAVLNIASTGSTITSSLTVFGTTAVLTLTVASGTGTVSGLSIEGRLARREPAVSILADDTTSEAPPRGVRSGSEISGEYLGVTAEAKGIADHIVWRYGNPQFRPTRTVENWFPDMFERDLYEVLAFTSTQLAESGRLFEIVGLTHRSDVAAAGAVHHSVDYVLQESRVQSDPGWFLLDDAGSLLDDTAVLAY